MSKAAETAKDGQAATVETVPVKVDGQLVHVPKTSPDPITGQPVPTTMIQACSMAKVDVPHYCYHPKLPVAGNCRMCLVEYGMQALGPDRKPKVDENGEPVIQKLPRPAIACATPIAPNMEIYTQSPGTLEMRKDVLEFMLINHPLDCPICDQAGECKLQEYSVEHGGANSLFRENKVHKPKQVDLGPRIMLDDERCILCSRCIRFTRDIAGDDALGFVDRGSHNTLTCYPGKSFDNNYTLNTVDLCPVGALTSKDFRFQMRVWFLKETKSLCASCGTGCNIVVGSREGSIKRFEPRENDAVNSSWMCDSGRLNYKWVAREDRLKETVVYLDGELVKSDWDSAVQAVVNILRSAEKGSVAIVASARQTNEELFLLSQIGSLLDCVTDSIPRTGEGDTLLVNADKNPNSNGVRIMGLSSGELGSHLGKIREAILDGSIKTLICFGEDLTKHGFDDVTLEKLDHLIVSDILPNELSGKADIMIPGCAHLEKRGTFTNVKGRVQRFYPAVPAPGDVQPEWQTLLKVLQGISDVSASIKGVESLFNWMAEETSELEGLTWDALGDTGADIEL